MPKKQKLCPDCGIDISHRGHSAKRCAECAVKKDRSSNTIRISKIRNIGESAKFKKSAHDVQGYACVICDWRIEGDKYGGCVTHHIVSVADGGKNILDNAAVLCPNCHAMAHRGLISKDMLMLRVKEAIRDRPKKHEERILKALECLPRFNRVRN